jgi:peroxiredoxin
MAAAPPTRLAFGDPVPPFAETSIRGAEVALPDPRARFVHLQFRRFAGCPVCNFHLHSLSRRASDLEAAGIREVAVFHSSREEMLKYQAEPPFDCIADPAKTLYRRFGVESSLRAPLHPAVLWAGLRGVLATRRFYKKAENGILGLPADFLIDTTGSVLAAHYGSHAYDNWDADELLRLAAEHDTRAGGHP